MSAPPVSPAVATTAHALRAIGGGSLAANTSPAAIAPATVPEPPGPLAPAATAACDDGPGEPDAASPPTPAGLAALWNTWSETGPGHLRPRELQERLQASRFEAVALPEPVAESVFGVEAPGGRIWLLPDFGCSPRRVEHWFVWQGRQERQVRVRRLVRPAEARRVTDRIERVSQGQVE